MPRRLLKFTIKASRTASPPMKPDGDLRKISRRGFKPLLVVIPPLLRKSTAKSSAGRALGRTGTGNVIGASANFRCTSIATGDVEGWVIYCSLVSSAKRSGWGCGNCYRASFRSTRPVAALCRKHGFREVGVYEKHARLDNRWLDVVIVERLISANLNAVSL